MDRQMALQISVEISKINFLLENLYAAGFRQTGLSHDDVPEISDELCRQAALPADTYGEGATPDELREHQELVGHRIAMFFANVQARLRSDEDR